jgi:hypothetical protein
MLRIGGDTVEAVIHTSEKHTASITRIRSEDAGSVFL